MPLTRNQFLKRYVGKERRRSTRAWKKGTSVYKTKKGYSVRPTAYQGIQKVVYYGDVVSYLMNNKIYAAKTPKYGYRDRQRSSAAENWDKGPQGALGIFGL